MCRRLHTFFLGNQVRLYSKQNRLALTLPEKIQNDIDAMPSFLVPRAKSVVHLVSRQERKKPVGQNIISQKSQKHSNNIKNTQSEKRRSSLCDLLIVLHNLSELDSEDCKLFSDQTKYCTVLHCTLYSVHHIVLYSEQITLVYSTPLYSVQCNGQIFWTAKALYAIETRRSMLSALILFHDGAQTVIHYTVLGVLKK